MTKLDAVNEILESVGEPPAAALNTGGNSEIADAERFLDRQVKTILARGWWCNTLVNVAAKPGLVKLTTTGTGTFQWGETVTRGSATGTFCYTDGVYVYVYNDGTAAFTTGTLTGSTSGATRTITVVATTSTGKIAVDSDWLFSEASQYGEEFARPTVRGGFLFDPDNNTDQFSKAVQLRAYDLLAFTDLPQNLARYITLATAVKFQRYLKRGSVDDQMLQQELMSAKGEAEQEDIDQKQTNVLATSDAMRVRGGRYRTGLGGNRGSREDYA